MKRLLTFLTLLTVFIGVGWATTVTKTMTEIATANNWVTASGNGTQTCYTSFNLDANITISTTGSANCGSFWGSDWRLYEAQSGNVIISAATGCTLQSVTFTYTSNNNGVLVFNGNNITSGTACTISGTSAEFTVSHSSGSKAGQARITQISVTYESGSTPEPDPTTPSGTITFNPVAGEVTSGTEVAISFSGTCDGIKYTTDGTSPSASNGTVYDASNKPVITGATTIKAAAYNYSNSKYAFGTEATASYTVTIPSVNYDGTATFKANEDYGTSPLTKGPVSFACSNGVLDNHSEYRLYKNSTTTFTVPDDYKIVKIEFEGPGGSYAITGFANITGLTTSETSGTWTGEAQSVSFTASGNQVRATLINVYFTAPDVTSEIKRVIKTNGDADNESGGWIGDWSDNCTTPEEISGNHYTVTADAGQTIQFKAGCNTNYQILEGNVSAVDASGTTVTLTKVSSDNSGIVFSFIMPASDVTITANFTNYRGTLRLAGHFNGNSTWRTGTNGPAFSYDSTDDKYTISAYFTGIDDGGANDYFFLTLDGAEKHPQADNGNYYIYDLNGGAMPFNLSGGPSNNFGCAPGVYNIEINGALTSMSFTKQEPTITISPAEGEVTSGTTVTATSTLTTLISNIKTNFDSNAAGDVAVQVSTDGTNFTNSVSITEDATVTAKASIGNIVVTETATYTVSSSATTGDYVKVTSTTDLTDGEYLIVYEDGPLAFDGSLTTLDKTGNSIAVTITDDDKIPSSATVDAAVFTYNATNKTLQSASGYYIGQTSDGNGLLSSTSTQYVNNITFDESGNANIVSSGGAYLRYNATSGQTRFRYFKSSTYTSQKAVALYKKTAASNKSAAPVITPEGGNVVGYSQEVEITQANGGIIYYTTDGTTPTEDPTHQYNGAFFTPTVAQLGDEVTVTAVAKEDGKELSNPVSVTYKFVSPVKPTFTPAAGTYPVAQNVSMATTTEGADVYYTTNSELTYDQIVAQGTKFTEPINVSEETTFYAVAAYYDTHAERYAVSSITQAKYKFAEVESEDLDYTHPFTGGTGLGKFTTVEGDPDITVWTVTDDYGARGSSYIDGTNYTVGDSWLISPYINLTDAVEPVLSFKHSISKYFIVPNEQATVWIRTYGGEWTQLATTLPANSNGLSGYTHYSEEYDLSDYNNQLIQVGFKYVNPYENRGGGIWEIQDFSVAETYSPPIEVENIAEYLALPIGTSNIKFKNPVIVQYHYISSTGKSYIYVKDDSGCAYFHQPADGETINQLANGDIIAGGFTGNKVADEMVSDEESNFAMFTDLENFAPNGDKGLADPEHETIAHIADATTGVALNNHYITIKKVKLSALYKPEDVSYGDPLYFDIDNEAHIGYNKFHIDWSVVDDLDAYYNITGIQTAYNNVMEFHPTEIVKWEESVVTLRQLCDEGVTTAGENEYTISNNLMCVFAKDNSIWVKDDTGQSIWPATPADGDLNFEVYAEAAEGIDANTRLNQAYYDQSNWCEIKLADGVDASQFEGQIIKGGTIHGEFTDKLNPTLENVTLTSAAISSEGDYALNYYMPANFFGRQKCYNPNHSTDYGQNYFFMTPKPQEYAQIVWAVWDASTTSMIMSTDDNRNGHRFAGEFEIDLSMNDGASSYSDIQNGATYNFTAILRKVSGSGSKAAGDSYKVYPLDLNGQNPATAIESVVAGNGEVKSVKYVNVAGIVSDVPFQGVNIVVTEYTDGSRTTTKMLKK